MEQLQTRGGSDPLPEHSGAWRSHRRSQERVIPTLAAAELNGRRPSAEAALTRTRTMLGIGGLSDTSNWLKFLQACAETALDAETGIVVAPDFIGV